MWGWSGTVWMSNAICSVKTVVCRCTSQDSSRRRRWRKANCSDGNKSKWRRVHIKVAFWRGRLEDESLMTFIVLHQFIGALRERSLEIDQLPECWMVHHVQKSKRYQSDIEQQFIAWQEPTNNAPHVVWQFHFS